MVLIYESDPLDNEDARGGVFIMSVEAGSTGRKSGCRRDSRFMSARRVVLIWSLKISGSRGKRDRCSKTVRTE